MSKLLIGQIRETPETSDPPPLNKGFTYKITKLLPKSAAGHKIRVEILIGNHNWPTGKTWDFERIIMYEDKVISETEYLTKALYK